MVIWFRCGEVVIELPHFVLNCRPAKGIVTSSKGREILNAEGGEHIIFREANSAEHVEEGVGGDFLEELRRGDVVLVGAQKDYQCRS